MAFAFKRSLTTDHTQCGSSDSSSFPVLVKLDASNAGTTLKTVANGGHIQNTVTQSGGNAVTMPADLIFTSDSGGTTKIPWEIDSYDATNGVLWAWVQLSTLSHSSNIVFYVFYGDASITTQQNTSSFSPANVWDTNYRNVLHLPNGSSLSTTDSTSNNTTNTNHSAGATTGQIDGGGNFVNATPSYIQTAAMNLGTAFTVDAWVNLTSLIIGNGVYYRVVENNFATGFYLGTDGATSDTRWILIINNNFSLSIGTVNLNTWTHLVAVYTGTVGVLYINGVMAANGVMGAPTIGSSTVNIGANGQNPASGESWQGGIDEVRFSTIARSADWITAEYNNQLNPESFVTAGSETALGGGGIIARPFSIFQAVNRSNTY